MSNDKIRKQDWYEKRVSELIPKAIEKADAPYAHFILRWLREGPKVAREYGKTMAIDAYGNLKKGGFIRGNKLIGDVSDKETGAVQFLMFILGGRGYVTQQSRCIWQLEERRIYSRQQAHGDVSDSEKSKTEKSV